MLDSFRTHQTFIEILLLPRVLLAAPAIGKR
jgi:hypothetical protein